MFLDRIMTYWEAKEKKYLITVQNRCDLTNKTFVNLKSVSNVKELQF